MAQGDVTLFEQYYKDLGDKTHDHANDTYKVGIVTSSTTPTASTADPRWGAGGTTNFSTNEVSTSSNYSAGGPTLASQSWTLSGGGGVFDADDVSISQDASGFTDGRWGIVYNDTSAGKECVAFVDLGGVVSIQTAPLNINWNASGIFKHAAS